MVREIPLTRGYVALVDDEDYERVASRKWYAEITKNTIYAAHKAMGQRKIYLHRVILGEPAGRQVDHWDGNGLDCRRSNLRVASRSQNARNFPKHRDNASGYKGVSVDRRYGTYRAGIGFAGIAIRLGAFADPVEAAHAYDEAARRLHGEFARLNFPRTGERAA